MRAGSCRISVSHWLIHGLRLEQRWSYESNGVGIACTVMIMRTIPRGAGRSVGSRLLETHAKAHPRSVPTFDNSFSLCAGHEWAPFSSVSLGTTGGQCGDCFACTSVTEGRSSPPPLRRQSWKRSTQRSRVSGLWAFFHWPAAYLLASDRVG